MAFSLKTELGRAILGQKRTGKHKQFVLIYDEFVIKGPYTAQKLQNICTRSAILREWGANFVVHPSSQFESEGAGYLVFPSFYKGYELEHELHQESFSENSYRILKNSPTLSLKDALTKDPVLWEKVPDIIYDMCLLNILGVGDAGHRNIQVNPAIKDIHIIDFEENLGTDRDDEEFYFSKPCAKALKWGEKATIHYGDVAAKLESLRSNALLEQLQLTSRLERAIKLLRQFQRTERKIIGSVGHMTWNGMRGTSKTYSGIDFDVAKSALQKWIRRGETEKALMIATELYRFSEIDGATAAVTNLFNRLCIIAHEDVGPANLPLVLEITDIVESEKRDYHQLLAMVQLLAQSPKTRMMSHAYYVYVVLEHLHNKPQGESEFARSLADKGIVFDEFEEIDYPDGEEIPDLKPYLGMTEKRLREKNFTAFTWAFSCAKIASDHTLSKKRRKFSKGVNSTGKADILLWELLRKFLPDSTCDSFVKAYYNHTENRPFLSCALLSILFDRVAEKSNQVNDLAILWRESPVAEQLLKGEYVLTVDDYVVDKHTKAGRKQGKDTKEFVSEGALVANQDPTLFNSVFYELYTNRTT